ncbi:MFS transporter [Actinomadura sp. DC4]|uniref:MFS transporter n=1 Tax=Actinomadura sp. DC4 TaxID=3055069 RepID=UPI0025B1FBA0|nr:MFS transporter [Actinomadura sp. DC4]MDN3358493.1 MFS transporter [Actinomadura sp. DC4]
MTLTQVATAARTPLPRDFKKWFCGTIIATTGNVAFSVTLQWTATTHGGIVAGVVLACGTVPQMILLPIGGAVADRVGVRRVMLITLVSEVLASLSLAAVVVAAGPAVWVLISYSTIIGAGNGFHLPATTSMVRRLVEKDQLPRAHATQKAGQQMAAFAGAPLGGLMATAGGLVGAALINAMACVLVIVTLLGVRPALTPPPSEPRASLGREVRDGILLAARDPLLRPSLLVMAATAAFFAPVAPLLTPLLVRMHHWEATAVGWLMASQGMAFFLLAILISRRGALRRLGLTSAAGIAAMGVGVGIIALTPTLAVGIAGASVAGLGYGLAATHLTPLVINASPHSHLSRTAAAMTLVQNLSVVMTFALAGGLAEATDPGTIALIDGLLLTAIGIAALTSRSFRRA